jgi:hypothetical protein
MQKNLPVETKLDGQNKAELRQEPLFRPLKTDLIDEKRFIWTAIIVHFSIRNLY